MSISTQTKLHYIYDEIGQKFYQPYQNTEVADLIEEYIKYEATDEKGISACAERCGPHYPISCPWSGLVMLSTMFCCLGTAITTCCAYTSGAVGYKIAAGSLGAGGLCCDSIQCCADIRAEEKRKKILKKIESVVHKSGINQLVECEAPANAHKVVILSIKSAAYAQQQRHANQDGTEENKNSALHTSLLSDKV